MRKRKQKKLLIILPIVLFLLIIVVFLTFKVSSLKNHAEAIKSDLKQMASCIKDKDAESAEKALAKSYEDCDKLEETLSGPFWKTASVIPRVKHEIEAGEELVGILRTAQDKLLTPFVALMKEKPLTGLKVGDNGFNVSLILSYLDFVDSVNPDLLALTEQLQNISTDSFSGSMVAKYKATAQTLMEAYSKASEYLPVVRAILGNGEDKYYLLTAQNSAEIRASGGFPGSIGTIQINDGLLSIGDFKGVNSVLSETLSERSEVTTKEVDLFDTWVYAPRDACFIPAFNKTGRVWAVASEDYQMANGAQEYADDPNQTQTDDWDQEYTDENTEEWEEEPEVDSGRTFNTSDYKSRLAFYGGKGKAPKNSAAPGVYYSSLAAPTTQTALENGIDMSQTDGLVLYSYANDFFGYGGTQDNQLHYVDGVISLTPAIIQMLMQTTGEITLSDGTVLNQDNASRVLQYDLYHKYFDVENFDETSDIRANKLFAETAKRVMMQFVSSIDFSRFTEYYEMFQEAAKKRILMIWLKDEKEEELVDAAGLSGQLNHNPDTPEVGVFFSLADPSKLGWYLDIDTKVVEEPVINYDGTRTYNVEVTLSNTISEDDILASNAYIIGSYGGAIHGYIHFFGPSGGRLDNFETDGDLYITTDTYMDLDVGYTRGLMIQPGESIVFQFKATTAPFVQTPLEIVKTPTLTEYR